MKYSYPYAVALGLLYYPLQQALFYLRFQRFNTSFYPIDLALIIVGACAFLMLFRVLRKTEHQKEQLLQWFLFLVFGIPCSVIGSIGGGMLGYPGVLIFGLAPVAIVLLIGKGIAKLSWK